MPFMRFFALLAWLLAGLASPAAALDLPGLAQDASAYAAILLEGAPPQENPAARDAALARARAAAGVGNWTGAVAAYEQAITRGDRQSATWLSLSEALERAAGPPNLQRALQAAYQAYSSAATPAESGAALLRMGRLLEERLNRPAQALEAYREAAQQAPGSPGLAERIRALRQAVGLQVKSVRADPESEPPRVCVTFSDALSQRRALRFEDFLRIEPDTPLVADRSGDTLCIAGLEHGRSYELELREGLPGADGLTLKAAQTQTVRVGNRKPSVAFPGRAFILPPLGDGVPVVTVNVEQVAVKVYRINDRNLVHPVNRSEIMTMLGRYDAERIAEQDGALLWEGRLAVERPQRNRQTRTSFPIGRVLGERRPGIYVVTAEPDDGVPGEESWQLATQWVVVSDLGLTAFQGRGGLHLFARSLETAAPLGGAEIVLLARNNEELARAVTDADGHARFDAGLLRGKGGNGPAAALAYAGDDFNLLDLTGAAFDLSDRGVSGRDAPGPLDAFLYSDRGVYRPGETVRLGALLRDARAAAVEGLPLTLKVLRPNGTPFRSIVVRGEAAGGAVAPLELAATAPLGTWTVEARVEPEGPPIGRLAFQVEEFVPERLKVELSADAPEVAPQRPVMVKAQARFLYGPPAAGLDGAAEMTIEPDPDPWPAFPGYRFGLAQESFPARQIELAFPATDADGVSRVTALLPAAPDTTLPLRATVRVAVSEPGGRPTRQALTLPVRAQELAIGVKPRFAGDGVEQNSEAGFEIVALDRDGRRIAAPDLHWELFEERASYQLVLQGGSARYEAVSRDAWLRSGTLAVPAEAPALLSERVGWGRYRLELFDRRTGAATSVRFRAGWQMALDPGDRPDRAEVTVEREHYAPGETARLHVRAPFAGEALVTVATDRIHLYRLVPVPAEGATIEIPVSADWGAGAYATATVYRPLVKDSPRAPVRAIGLAWIGLDPAGRSLGVEIAAPERAQPRRTLTVPVRVTGAAPGSPLFLTLAAVDEGILQLTDFAAPDPVAHYLGKRRLALDIRDDYGRLIEWTGAPVGAIRQGGDAAALGQGLPAVPTRTVALFAGPVTVGADGQARVNLDLPDFNGALRLMAVAWSRNKVGSGSATLTVRDDLVAEATLPRFLAPGDESRLTLSLHNVSGPDGAYRAALTTEGPLALDAAAPLTADLPQGERRSLTLGLRGAGAGIGRIGLRVTGPGGIDIVRDWSITVRPARPTDTQFTVKQLPPGESVRADAALLAGYVPGTAGLSLSFDTAPRIDVAGLLQALDRWSYGCLEQTVSRAFPLLDAAGVAALRPDARDRAAEVDQAVARTLDMQRFDGAFGLWGPRDESDAWVSAYALEFLTRARAQGHAVPDAPYRLGLQYLREQADQGRGDAADLAARTYALYVLSLADSARMGALRYFHDAFLKDLPTPLAKGQLAAALARAGDAERARAAFAAAFADLGRQPWAADYGSAVRDAAALIVLATEADMLGDRLGPLLDRLPVGENVADRTSTQEQAWLLRAAFALRQPGGVALAVNGRQIASADPTFVLPPPAELTAGVTVRNAGAAPVWEGRTIHGVPVEPQPAARNGMRLTRRFLDRSGAPVDLDAVRQNDRFVVLLEGEAQTRLDHRALVEHALPAGWEIENAKLGGADVGDLPWLGELTKPQALELRDDRFAAAVDLTPENAKFRFAFLVRAVTPGRYELPGGRVQDMYKPAFFARQAAGRIAVLP